MFIQCRDTNIQYINFTLMSIAVHLIKYGTVIKVLHLSLMFIILEAVLELKHNQSNP